jgi:hypothetical protein
MRGLILFLSIFFSLTASADIQQRISLYTRQSDILRQVCFMPNGTFLTDRILFNKTGSISETSFDCNAQALALEEEHNAIEDYLQSGQCPLDTKVQDQGLIDLLSGTSPIVEEIACPGAGSFTNCMNSLECNLMKSIVPAGHALGRMLSDHPVFHSCDGTGSCFTNLGKAIWDNLWDSVKSFYHVGKMAAGWVGNKIGSLWRAEDATSTRGIAATEATDSELNHFLAHPIDYLVQKSKQFLNSISEGIKSRYGCAKWSGTPHLSECLQPMSFECADCNGKINMVCGVVGYIGGNFISNFFTGGAAAAARISAKIAASTVFKVARTVPGAERIMAKMATGGRISRGAALLSGTLRSTWAAVNSSRVVRGTLSAARQLHATGAAANGFARKKIFLYAAGQDTVIGLVKGYKELTFAAYKAGYRATNLAAVRASEHIASQFPRLSDITAGKFAHVRTPQDYLREATKMMPESVRKFMRVSVATGAKNEKRVIVYDTRNGKLDSTIRVDFTP